MNLDYISEINKVGSASWDCRVLDTKSTPANLKMHNRIKIFSGTKCVWIGYIENLHSTINIITVNCVGILGIFNKRVYSGNGPSVQVLTNPGDYGGTFLKKTGLATTSFNYGSDGAYLDNDLSGTVSIGDQRVCIGNSIANGLGYAAGSMVKAGDTDIGTAIVFPQLTFDIHGAHTNYQIKTTGALGSFVYGVNGAYVDVDNSQTVTANDIRCAIGSTQAAGLGYSPGSSVVLGDSDFGVTGAVYVNYILGLVNADQDTGISAGNMYSTYGVANVDFIRSEFFEVMSKLAIMSDLSEFEIDENLKLNFVPQLGTDKSNSIVFQYLVDQIATATIFTFDITVQGADMLNNVIGVGNSLTSTQADTSSTNEFGRLEGAVNFSQTASQTNLDNETISYIDLHKVECYNPTIKPNSDKIDPDSYDVGDTVQVVLDNGFMTVDDNYRIIKKEVKISPALTPDVTVDLLPASINVLPQSLFGHLQKLKVRISLLESKL